MLKYSQVSSLVNKKNLDSFFWYGNYKKPILRKLTNYPNYSKFVIKVAEYQINDDLIDLAKNKNIRICLLNFIPKSIKTLNKNIISL